MLSAIRLSFVLAVQLVHPFVQCSSNYSGTEKKLSRGEGFSHDIKRCNWVCRVTASDFTKHCDPVFTKKRLIKFHVKYDLTVDKKCLKQGSDKTLDKFIEGDYDVWTPANITLSSFSRAIQGIWSLSVCYERGQIDGFCRFEPRMTTALRSGGEVEESIEEKGYVLIKEKEVQPSWFPDYVVFIIVLPSIVFVAYSPALLCIFSPTLFMENGIRYIGLERASPVSIRGFLGNNLFSKDCSIFESTSRYHRGKKCIFRLMFMVFLFLLITIPGIIGYRVMRPYLLFSGPFHIVSLAIFYTMAVCFLLCPPRVSPEVKKCFACRELKPNPPSRCLCVDLPRMIFNHMRIQPLILMKCWSWFVRSLQRYFQIINPKGYTRWVIRVPLFFIFFLTLPFAIILLLIASLLKLGNGLLDSCPQYIVLQSTGWREFLSKLYTSSLFVRLPALKKFVHLFIAVCFICLPCFGGYILWTSAFMGVLLCIILALTMVLLFPEESLPYTACFLLFCYHLMSAYSSFTNGYHDLSLAIFYCYKKQTSDQISQEELCANDRNVTTDPSESKRKMVKIPKELFDMACEEVKPIREALCLLFLKDAFILTFLFLVVYLTMQLHIDVNFVTKTTVAVFTGLFPKIVSKYFEGERQKRMEALAIEERVPKIVEAYLNRVPRANQGQENSGADTDEVRLQVDESEENTEIVNT